jgi:drug/metabolite transporter (DMT)-like permease
MARAYLAVSIVTVLWAINFTVGKICTESIDPFFIASSRIVATGVFFYLLLPREERKIRRSDWKAILPLSLSGIATNHVCFAAGIYRTTPSHSAIIHALVPVFVGLMAWMFIGEGQGARAILGMAIAVAGALTVVVGATRQEVSMTLWGDVISACGIVAFSFYTVHGRRVVQGMSSRRVVTLAFLFAVPLMVPLLFYGIARQPSWSGVPLKGWLALAYMLVFANMICYLLHSYALTRLKAGQVAAFTDIQPAIGISVAILAGKDHLTASLVVGAAIALVGVVLVQFHR